MGQNFLLKTSIVCAVFGIVTAAHAGDVIKTELRTCPTGVKIGEVNSCGKVWKIGKGEAMLNSNGAFAFETRGLVLNDASTGDSNGTADGVTHVVGTVLCNGAIAAETERVPLSKDGNAKYAGKLGLPASCIAPSLVLREVWEGKVGGWFAADGF